MSLLNNIDQCLPGSFLVRNEALVIIDFETVVTVVIAGDKATLIPIGPSLGWPAHINTTVRLNTPLQGLRSKVIILRDVVWKKRTIVLGGICYLKLQ